jgi:DNA-binding MarR family transcriptional regulator
MKALDIGRLTSAIYRAGTSILNDRLKDLDIKSGQIPFLYAITMKEGMSQLELAEKASVSKSAITKVVNLLAAKDYVRRETDPDDQRIWRLYLTDRGRRESKRIQDTFRELQLIHAKFLTDEEALQTVEYLERVLKSLSIEKERFS